MPQIRACSPPPLFDKVTCGSGYVSIAGSLQLSAWRPICEGRELEIEFGDCIVSMSQKLYSIELLGATVCTKPNARYMTRGEVTPMCDTRPYAPRPVPETFP